MKSDIYREFVVLFMQRNFAGESHETSMSVRITIYNIFHICIIAYWFNNYIHLYIIYSNGKRFPYSWPFKNRVSYPATL